MWFVRFFEFSYVIFCEFDIKCSNRLIEVIHFGSSDDGSCDVRLAQDPCECNLRSGYATFFRNFRHTICYREIFVAEVQAVSECITIGTWGFAATTAFAISCKEATRHRAPGDKPNALILA